MAKTLTALVTAGGTAEPIDDVRAVTNFSTGRFGHALSRELAKLGVSVNELCPRSTLERLGAEAGVSYSHFTDTASLKAALEAAAPPSIVLHAAAVADYTPVREPGKISSGRDELLVRMVRTPKLIAGLRELYGRKTLLVGFKLLSGVEEGVLVAAAKKQMKENRLHMVVANDLQWLRGGQHPILVCTAEGGLLRFDGSRDEVAGAFAEFLLRRAETHWFESRADSELRDEVDHAAFDRTLELAKELNLLYDESGNVSARVPGGLLVSPRAVDKSLLTPENAVYTQVNLEESLVRFAPISPTVPGAAARLAVAGELKPSIDTGMSAMLYEALPELQSIMHFHGGWGAMASATEFPYPCGAREEAVEVLETREPGPLAAELVHHGFLVGLGDGAIERLRGEWRAVLAEYELHLEEVEQVERLSEGVAKPVWHGQHIVGLVFSMAEGVSVYLNEAARGRGVGRRVLEQLRERHTPVLTVDDCEVRDFYKAHGFEEAWSESARGWVLTPRA